MKHFMRWPLYLSVLVVLLDLLVFIVSVKAGILVSAGTVIYIFIAVQLFRYHKPLIVNDMIAFANQYESGCWKNWRFLMPLWIWKAA